MTEPKLDAATIIRDAHRTVALDPEILIELKVEIGWTLLNAQAAATGMPESMFHGIASKLDPRKMECLRAKRYIM